MNVAHPARSESGFNEFEREFQADEQDSCARNELTDPPRYLQSVQLRKTDVEEDEIRLKLLGFLESFQSIRRLPDDLILRPLV